MIPVLTSTEPLKRTILHSLPHHELKKDWSDRPSDTPLSFCLALDPQRLHFHVSRTEKPWHDEKLQAGEYVRNLWEMDVAEVFLCDDRTHSYQEFNLAPSGAWWSMLFSGPRQENVARFKLPQDVWSYSEVTGNTWCASLSVLRADLSVQCAFDSSCRMNVSCALGEKSARRYFSWTKLSSDVPDFHLPKDFECVELKSS